MLKKKFSTELGQQPLVYTAANVFKDLCYSYRDSLMAGIIVAGYDEKLGGQIYCIPLGGMIKREKIAIGGSGSSYVYGYVDSQYREKMTKEECLKFTTNSKLMIIVGSFGSSCFQHWRMRCTGTAAVAV